MHIGILKAGSIPDALKSHHFDYWEMWFRVIKHYCPSYKISIFDLVNNQFPRHISDCDAYICASSPSSTYSNEQWIIGLMEFVRACHAERKKLVGVCFGHQAIAVALGGECERSLSGWGVGIKRSYLIAQKEWMDPRAIAFDLIYSHQDQITRLPDVAESLGYSAHCAFTMYSIGNHILGLQGHPEWSIPYAIDLLHLRTNIIGESVINIGLQTLNNMLPDSEIVLNWLIKFILEPTGTSKNRFLDGNLS